MVREKQLDLTALLRLIGKKIWLIIAFVAVGAFAAVVITKLFVSPLYRSGFTLCVYNTQKVGEKLTTSDIYASQMLLSSCSVMIQSRTVMTAIEEQLNDGTKIRQLQNAIHVVEIENTNILSVQLSSSDPETAYRWSKAFMDVAPPILLGFLRTGSLEILDEVTYPVKPYNINYWQNGFAGAGTGLVVSLLLILFMNMINVRINSVDDIKQNYHIPVIGEIPDFEYSGNGQKLRGNQKRLAHGKGRGL